MANIKYSFAFAVVSCFLLVQSPVAAQAPPKTTVDFILDVVELLSEELINRLADYKLPQMQWPQMQLPSLPDIQFPQIQFPQIQVPSLPEVSVATQPIRRNPFFQFGSQEQLINWVRQNQGKGQDQLINWIIQNQGQGLGPNIFNPRPTVKPPCDDCEPEKVKIIVIDDCDDKKSSEESSEESNELKVTYRKGRYNYKKFNNN